MLNATKNINLLLILALFIFLYACSSDKNIPSVINPSGKIEAENCSTIVALNNNGNGTTSATGTVQFEDRTQNDTGFTGSILKKPVRYANIEVIRCFDKTVLASGVTDNSGKFNISFTNTSISGVYIRVLARVKTDPTTHGPGNITVRNNTRDNAIHAVSFTAFDDSTSGIINTGTNLITASVDGKISRDAPGGIFNLLDVATERSIYMQDFYSSPLPDLTIYWEKGSTDGTYFNGSRSSIHVLGVAEDPDEYDDDVIAHEFGHFLAVKLSRDDSPGGDHQLDDPTEDIRLAWSEGWASFFATASKNKPTLLDTNAFGNSFFEIEKPSFSQSAIYTTNELSVSTVLWDLYDNSSTAESFDNLAVGFKPIWNIFENYFPTSSNVSMEDFADGVSILTPENLEGFIDISKNRSMEFFNDTNESDSTFEEANTITLDSSVHHNLYFDGLIADHDYHKFAATGSTQYTVFTEKLTNGADTFIEIYGTDKTTLITDNDNADDKTYLNCTLSDSCPKNNQTNLSSQVTFTPTENQDIFIKVSRSPEAPSSSGFYGAYNINITSP